MRFADIAGRVAARTGAWETMPFRGPREQLRHRLDAYSRLTGRRSLVVRLRADAGECPAHLLAPKYGPSITEAITAGAVKVRTGHVLEPEGAGYRSVGIYQTIDRDGAPYPLEEAYGLLARFGELLEVVEPEDTQDESTATAELRRPPKGQKQ